jgi:hypothetical protein
MVGFQLSAGSAVVGPDRLRDDPPAGLPRGGNHTAKARVPTKTAASD